MLFATMVLLSAITCVVIGAYLTTIGVSLIGISLMTIGFVVPLSLLRWE